MKSFKITVGILAAAIVSGACNQKNDKNELRIDPPQTVSEIGGVIKGTAYIPVQIETHGQMNSSASVSNPITVVNPPNVRFNIDTSRMTSPAPKNAKLSFGKAKVSELFDNDLNVCGTTADKKCTAGFIRIYTTGQSGAGLWNSAGNYGMPMFAYKTGTPALSIGLAAANAAVVQKITIDANKHVLHLSDFPSPAYNVTSDFTEAGAGSYSTTLVIEYGLLE